MRFSVKRDQHPLEAPVFIRCLRTRCSACVYSGYTEPLWAIQCATGKGLCKGSEDVKAMQRMAFTGIRSAMASSFTFATPEK